jgi:hypothetical protein
MFYSTLYCLSGARKKKTTVAFADRVTMVTV